MPSYLDYAALSAIVYNKIKDPLNVLASLPPGWSELPIYPNGTEANSGLSLITGFNARAYQNGADIVIAYEGTDTDTGLKQFIDFAGGNSAAFGFSPQLIQAALFYEKVKAANPGANITFTGHSLGGGLASVMGVWFGKAATTFDQAPFEYAAINSGAVGAVITALAANLYVDTDLLTFNPFNYLERQANITNYFVPGEVLKAYISWLPNVVGAGMDYALKIGGASLLPGSDFENAVTLHSMILNASLLMSQTFADDTVLLPQLLTEIFDEGLYGRDPTSPNRDFLSSLLNDQIRVGYDNADGLLARFAADIDTLTQYDTNLQDALLGKALIDVAIADYYFMQTGFSGKDFFNTIIGGITFDLADMGANWLGNKATIRLDNAITQELNLDLQSRLFLNQDNAWSIQSGLDALNVTGTGANNDAMIGGITDDTLDGGAGRDFLYGGEGLDTLSGGTGNDLLEGGIGNDTYIFATGDGFDTIIDSDGLGQIKWDTLVIKGSTGLAPNQWTQLSNTAWRDETNHITYILNTQSDNSQTLIIKRNDDSLQIEHFVDTNLGITLGAGTPPPATTILNGDQRAQLIGIEVDLNIPPSNASYNTYKWSATSYAADGTLINGVAEANFNDVIYGSSLDETINGLGGNDALSGGAGKDTIDGGIGNDLIGGGAGSDIIYGGAGNDVILSATGLSAAQRLRPGEVWQAPAGTTAWTQSSTWGVADNGNNTYTIYGGGSLTQDTAPDIVFAGAGDDRVTGGLGDDYIDGGLGNDSLTGHGGNDVIDGGDGDDFIKGDGLNTLNFYQTVAEANHGNDILDGGAGVDTIIGGGKNDVLFGGIGDDHLWGDDQSETDLAGQYHGNDYLDGGDGNDQLVGGGMDDTLIGGVVEAFNEGDSRKWGSLHTAANDSHWRNTA